MARTPDAGEARKVSICFRLTQAEKADLDRSRKGVKMSAWMRDAALEKAARDR